MCHVETHLSDRHLLQDPCLAPCGHPITSDPRWMLGAYNLDPLRRCCNPADSVAEAIQLRSRSEQKMAVQVDVSPLMLLKSQARKMQSPRDVLRTRYDNGSRWLQEIANPQLVSFSIPGHTPAPKAGPAMRICFLSSATRVSDGSLQYLVRPERSQLLSTCVNGPSPRRNGMQQAN